MHETAESIREGILRWVRDWIVAENLCPFARPVLARGLLEVRVVADSAAETVLQALVDAGQQLLAAEDEEATTLVVLPDRSLSFDDALDLSAMAEALLEDLGLAEELQLVVFHPDFCFEGEDADDPGNAVNRSPWPQFHLLQQASVARAIERHPDIDAVPERNRRHLAGLSRDAIRRATDITIPHPPAATPRSVSPPVRSRR